MADLYASVDLGGTNMKAVLADGEGAITCQASVPTESYGGPDHVLARIAGLVNRLAGEAGARPAALGMAVPGLADLANGVTKFLPNLPTQWRDVSVRAKLAPEVGCPVYLLNDVRTATLGELTFGHGRDFPNVTMAFFALGTGIGGGVVVDGKLRLGPLGAAGELGHQTVIENGVRCGCGSRGCVETVASGPAITAEGIRLMLSGQAPRLFDLTGGEASKVTTREMAVAATAGDEAVRGAIVRAAQYLGIAVANVIAVLHPDLIVLGGGVAAIGDLLFDAVRDTVTDRVRMLPAADIAILPSKLGDRAGVLGGIALAMNDGLLG